MILILLSGLILRLLLIPLYAHPDLRGFNLAAQLIVQKGQLTTFYDYLSHLPPQHQLFRMYHADLFIYPPLAYLVPALFMKTLLPLYPEPLFSRFLYDISLSVGHPDLPRLLYLLKGQYLLADFACLWLLLRLIDTRHRHLGAVLWLFNPILIYITYLIGQFDIYIALFSLLAVYLARRFPPLAAISLGLAAGFKPFPLLLLPFLPGKKTVNIFLGLFTYFLIIWPYLSSPGFRQYALFAAQTAKLTYTQISLSGSQYLSLFFVAWFLLFFWHIFRRPALSSSHWFAMICLIFYSVSVFHPQWFIWAQPFFILIFISHPPSRLPLLYLQGLNFLLILTFDPTLNFGILGLNFSLNQFLDHYQLAGTFASVLRSAFAALSLYLIWSWSHLPRPTRRA